MTMICLAKNKAELKAQLDAGCVIREPTPFGETLHHSQGGMLMIPGTKPGFSEPVVLDPETRRRFALITKLPNGTWRVK